MVVLRPSIGFIPDPPSRAGAQLGLGYKLSLLFLWCFLALTLNIILTIVYCDDYCPVEAGEKVAMTARPYNTFNLLLTSK
jgi:hypothetical protein